MKNIKVAIIGLGYWGQIILKNLTSMGYKNIATYDDNKPSSVDSLASIKANNIFICVNSSAHDRICEYFLSKGNTNVFCEKPLTGNVRQSKELFELARKYNSYLFVDWLFLYNNEVNYIKSHFFDNMLLGKIKNIYMNRLNKGPVRTDTNAIQDLASHDISILRYIFNKKPDNIHWISFKKNNDSYQEDSCIGLLKYDDANVQINCSWEHSLKDRTCLFEFDNGMILWDDISKKIIVNGEPTIFNTDSSPIFNSINHFFYKMTDQETIESITLDVEEILNATCFTVR